jgi:LL-diaminopimelate aminotransferase
MNKIIENCYFGGILMKTNSRLNKLSEYHFHKLDAIRKEFVKSGRILTDLSIGDPDLPVHSSIIGGLIKGLGIKDYNKYPPYDGIEELKLSIIKYYEEVFSVHLETDEVLILIGSKEGINNIIPAVCGIGDYAAVPDFGYPVYKTCCHLWGVNTMELKLSSSNDYLPDLSDLSKNEADKLKLMILNYPNNPTGAVGNKVFFEEIIKYCYENNIVLCNDGAYNEIIAPGETPVSILQFDEKRQCIEFGTFSKTYNMTGFRIGYVVGNRQIVKALLKVKSNVDSGQFIPVQYAAIEALKLSRDYVNGVRQIYNDRRTNTEMILREHNIEFFEGAGTFYIWCKTPEGYNTEQFCEELLNVYGIVVTPGVAFGPAGADHFRIALTKDTNEIVNAIGKIKIY